MCSLQVDTLFVLDSATDSMIMGMPSAAALGGRGNVVIVDPRIGVPYSYGIDGHFLGYVGGKGAGPGEFQRATLAAYSAGGDLYIMDVGLARLTILPNGGGPPLSFGLPVALPAAAIVVLQDGSVVLSVPTPIAGETNVRPFVHYDTAKAALASFGAKVILPNPSFWPRVGAHLTSAAGGGFWAVGVFTRQLEKYRNDLSVERAMPAPAWFRPLSLGRPSTGEDGRTPTMHVRGITRDTAGHLWVVTNVANAEWRRYVRREGRQRAGPRRDVSKRFDTVIEIIEPATLEVVYQGRVHAMILHALGRGVYMTYSDDDGVPRVAIVRLTFIPK